MLYTIEIAFALSAAAYIVLLVAAIVSYINNRKEQQEIAKLDMKWPIFENFSSSE